MSTRNKKFHHVVFSLRATPLQLLVSSEPAASVLAASLFCDLVVSSDANVAAAFDLFVDFRAVPLLVPLADLFAVPVVLEGFFVVPPLGVDGFLVVPLLVLDGFFVVPPVVADLLAVPLPVPDDFCAVLLVEVAEPLAAVPA